MQILLSDTGKRFNRDWIFRKLSYEFISGDSYAITGPNGSGKSTLLQVIAGAVASSEGSITFRAGGKAIEGEKIFRYISIATPSQELIEEMTLLEFLHFHKKFKPLLPSITVEDIISIISLEKSAHKQIRYYSSGMKQRVKLAQAVFSDTPCILFDEPCTNLDETGIAMYHSLVNDYCLDRIVIVSSNDRQEYSFCRKCIIMGDYK
ncbi:MAG: ATP-binding cassette domain-containing protein [Chitinophagaceae bacterium]|nr:ATP-binding cassette domain-containing protein [Chitinophagaceae bacterium]